MLTPISSINQLVRLRKFLKKFFDFGRHSSILCCGVVIIGASLVHGRFILFLLIAFAGVKVTWFQLAPFLKSVIIYFVIGSFNFFDSNIVSTLLKCAPILSLMAFIFFMGFKFTREYRYQQLILIGLIFSCAGDVFLDYRSADMFQFGMMAFAVAQIFYISAFGWKPLRVLIGLALFIFGGYAVSLMFKNFEGIIIYGVPIYCVLLLTMAWRANARVLTVKNLPKLLAGVGALFFVASDSLIAFDKFYSPIQYSKIYVISTYYVAQLGITLSVIDHEVMPKSFVKSN